MKISSHVATKFVLATALSIFSFSTMSAYEIKHGYSVSEGMEYYGVCNNGKDLMVVEDFKSGVSHYEGPEGKGKVKGGMDDAARKACGENKKDK